MSAKEQMVVHQQCEYDKEQLMILARRAIGTRSITEAVRDTGLSRSFISKILNGRLDSAPTKRSLMRFVDASSKVQNGVSVSELFRAAGYTEKNDMVSYNAVNVSIKEGNYLMSVFKYSTQALGMLICALLRKGMNPCFSVTPSNNMYVISTEEEGLPIIAMPAFTGKRDENIDISTTILRQLLVAGGIEKDRRKVFFIMLDNDDDFHFMRSIIPIVRDINISLLLTKNYQSFSEQLWIGDRDEINEGKEYVYLDYLIEDAK